jgi:Tol biopolymer transport system component
VAGATRIHAVFLVGAFLAGGCGATKSPAPTAAKRAGLIAFTRQNLSQRNQIYVVNSNGHAERPLTLAADNALDPVWSPDGKRIAFIGGRNATLFVMNADGTDKRLVTRGAGSPFVGASRASWSPDSTRLVFTVDLEVGHALYMVNVDGSGLHELRGARGTDPAWSPDGTTIAFSADDSGISLMSATGGKVRALTDGSCDMLPTWSPDGARLAYTFTPGEVCLTAPSEIHVVDADGDNERALAHASGELYDQSPAWSPDGGQIVFQRGDFAYGDIYVVTVADGRLTRLTSTHIHRDFDPSWQPVPRV